MGTLMQDVRYGLRMLVRNPGFTAVAVLTLALGIGANTAIFTVVNGALFRPLPYEDPERLVAVEGDYQGKPGNHPLSYPDFVDLREQADTLAEMAAVAHSTYTLVGGEEPIRVTTGTVSSNYFTVLGVEAVLGRTFLPHQDEAADATPVAILSHGLWQRAFGGDPEVLGRTVHLEEKSYTVIGVLPQGFREPDERDEIWVVLEKAPRPATLLRIRSFRWMQALARLAPGGTAEQARAQMGTLAQALEEKYPDSNQGWGVKVVPLHERIVGNIRPALLLFLGAVGFVLLIACANVANLLLVRGAARQKEISIRAALGAHRWRLIRQMLTESALLSAVGGALGLLLSLWGVDLILRISPDRLPRVAEMRVDGSVLGFAVLLSLLTGLLFGLLPALAASRTDLYQALKTTGGSSALGDGPSRARGFLVVGEIALSLVLLVGAGLLLRSFARHLAVDPGFDPENVLTLQLNLPQSGYSEEHQQVAFYEQLLAQVRTLPGVESAVVATGVPLVSLYARTAFTVEGRSSTSEDTAMTDMRLVGPGYFRTLRIPLRAGRTFSERDDADAPPVTLINETMARRYWPGESPIGRRIQSFLERGVWREVVGVVADVKQFRLTSETDPEMYIPFLQNPTRSMNLTVRTTGGPLALVPAVRDLVLRLDKNVPISSISTMEQVLSEKVAQPQFYAVLLGFFAAAALLLAALGIYGVVAYSASQRTHEIGIRMALGAQRKDVLRLVVSQGLGLALLGLLIGLVGSFGLTRLLSSFLFEVTATDPATFAGVAALLLTVALLACYLPARRASRVDPMVALRYE